MILVINKNSRSSKCHIKRKKSLISYCGRSMNPIKTVWSGDNISFENLKEEYDICQNCIKKCESLLSR